MAYLIFGRDTEVIKVMAFPLVLKEEARTWYSTLPQTTREGWKALWHAFLWKYGWGDTPKGLW